MEEIILKTFETKFGDQIDEVVDFTDEINPTEHFYRNEINEMFLNHYNTFHSIDFITENWDKASESKAIYHTHSCSCNEKYWGPKTKWE